MTDATLLCGRGDRVHPTRGGPLMFTYSLGVGVSPRPRHGQLTRSGFNDGAGITSPVGHGLQYCGADQFVLDLSNNPRIASLNGIIVIVEKTVIGP